jgi:hypothetical protein
MLSLQHREFHHVSYLAKKKKKKKKKKKGWSEESRMMKSGTCSLSWSF